MTNQIGLTKLDAYCVLTKLDKALIWHLFYCFVLLFLDSTVKKRKAAQLLDDKEELERSFKVDSSSDSN